MKRYQPHHVQSLMLLLLLLAAAPAGAQVFVQCRGDSNGDAVPDTLTGPGQANENVVCKHLTAGDGFISMADDQAKHQYMFGFNDVTGFTGDVLSEGMLAANFPAPTIAFNEGQEFYLTVTNVGMVVRPDLFDPHSVHFHGFPQAAAVFDGMPEGSIAINQFASISYYYNLKEPGTYMYHCHVEATEHMQMGMLGNLYVRPRQNRCGTTGNPACPGGLPAGSKFVYNDGDGTTRYDVEYPIQIGSFDPDFHDASETIQPLPFALMKDRYAMLNGRGYPDTINPDPLPSPENGDLNGGKTSQYVSTAIGTQAAKIPAGQKILLRISNLNVTRMYTLASLGIPMKVVGHNARLMRGPDGKDLSYTTNSVTLGGGESVDVILNTAGIPAGTYFLYTTNLNYLSNDAEDYGGMMTEIVIG
jgi:FtsP/CotA-like multicopper oxidase with cupredoxin domain